MIYLIQKDNGEQWEDYYKWVESVWNVPNNINVKIQYREFIQSNLNEFGIKLDDRLEHLFPVIDDEYSRLVLFKQFRKIITQHPIEDYLVSIGAIKLEFKELHY